MDLLKKRYLYILAGFITLLFMGVSLAWSIFVVPIEQLFGWTRAETSLAFTVNILCFSVGSILTGFLSKYLSFSHLLKVSALMIGVGFFGTSFVNEVWQLYITYGIIVGTGIGLGYNCVVSACPTWMPEKSATATGTLLMGYALSTAIFGPVLNILINSIGIVNTFKVLGIVCATGIFVCSLFIRTPSLEELSLLPSAPKKATGGKNMYTNEMVKTSIFWVYYVITIIFAGVGLSVVNHMSPMLTEGLLVSASTASLVISITSIVNGVGRLGWGILFDKLGVNKCVMMITTIYIIALFGLYLGYQTSSFALFIIAACLMMIPYGGNGTTTPTIIRSLFGNRTFSLNFSVLATNAIPASFFPSIIGTIQAQSGGYSLPIFVLAIGTVVSFAVTCLFIKQNKKFSQES